VRELPALEEVLSGLDREELKDLLLKLAERYPSLSGIIEGELALSASSGTHPVNADAIRRRLRASIQAPGYMEPYDDYWHPSGDLDEARHILKTRGASSGQTTLLAPCRSWRRSPRST